MKTISAILFLILMPAILKVLSQKRRRHMKRLFLSLVVCALSGGVAAAANLTIGASGRVTIELVGSDALFHNTLSIVSPTTAVAVSGCTLEPAVGLTGTLLLSEKSSQRGCRVVLDSDPNTPGIQPFP